MFTKQEMVLNRFYYIAVSRRTVVFTKQEAVLNWFYYIAVSRRTVVFTRQRNNLDPVPWRLIILLFTNQLTIVLKLQRHERHLNNI